MEITDIWMG